MDVKEIKVLYRATSSEIGTNVKRKRDPISLPRLNLHEETINTPRYIQKYGCMSSVLDYRCRAEC